MLTRYPISENLALQPSEEGCRILADAGIPAESQNRAYEQLARDLERVEASRRAEQLGAHAEVLLWLSDTH